MKPGIHGKGRLRSIRVRRRFRAPPQCIFDAWRDPEVAGKWLFATALRPIARVEIDARIGGSFRFVDRRGGGAVEYTGNYLEVVPSRRLVFTLSTNDIPRALTRVSVEFVLLATGCEVILTHENLPPDYASRVEARWIGIFYGLAETLALNNAPAPAAEAPRSRRNDEISVPDLR